MSVRPIEYCTTTMKGLSHVKLIRTSATINWMCQSCCTPFMGELGPRLTQCDLGLDLVPYQVASSPIQPTGHNRHQPKTGGCAEPLLGGGGAVTPSISNTTLPGPRFTSVTPGILIILIHPAVWPQWAKKWEAVPYFFWGSWVRIEHKVAWAKTYLHTKWHLDWWSRLATIDQCRRQTDRTGQDRRGQTDRQWSDCIGQTVFTNGRPKTKARFRFCFWHFINLSLNYLLRHFPTYYCPKPTLGTSGCKNLLP